MHSSVRYFFQFSTLHKRIILEGNMVVMFLIPAFGRQKQVDLFKFKTSLDYMVNSRSATVI